MDGVQGMELVCAYLERFGSTLVKSQFREAERRFMEEKINARQRMSFVWRGYGRNLDCL